MGIKIEGIDVSHWNKTETALACNPEFMLIKASEGLTFVDEKAGEWVQAARALDVPFGFYHYARAEKNAPEKEAEHFVRTVRALVKNGEAVLALDYEGKALSLKNSDEWAARFMERAIELTGIKPLLYCSQSVVRRFPTVHALGCGLWVARYRNKMLGAGDVKPWKFAAVWQYTSAPIDKDIFYGKAEQFKKYATPIEHNKELNVLPK